LISIFLGTYSASMEQGQKPSSKPKIELDGGRIWRPYAPRGEERIDDDDDDDDDDDNISKDAVCRRSAPRYEVKRCSTTP
jgi:hypothetical protein